jgi:hypothetical protein
MNNLLAKLPSLLKKNAWALAAFLIPLAIRSIPEILSWPYLLGLDTITYIPVIQSNIVFLSGPLGFIRYHLFYVLCTLINPLFSNTIVLLKVTAPLLMGSVAFMMYLYAKRNLKWSPFKSFLVALLVAIYFVSLRNSWDLYAQSFALIFLFAALIVFKSFTSRWRYPVTIALMVITVLAHELVTVILFFVLTLEAGRFLAKGLRRDSLFIFSLVASVLGLFLYTHYSIQTHTIYIPIITIASAPSVDLSLHIAGLLFYCYILLLPFVILGFTGLKDWLLKSWVALCISIPLLTMILTTTPLYYWNRWVYLLVYPLAFFAINGLDTLWNYWSTHRNKIRRFVPKALAITYVLLLLSLSGFYLTSTPDNQISFFADSGYLTYIPSTMLQNTLSISDNPSLVRCFQWITDNTSNDSAVVMHYALYDLARIYIKDKPLVDVRQGLMWDYIQNKTSLVNSLIDAADVQLSNGYSTVYTVWWADGKGWYEIPSLPPSFHLVYQSESMGVYIYKPAIEV